MYRACGSLFRSFSRCLVLTELTHVYDDYWRVNNYENASEAIIQNMIKQGTRIQQKKILMLSKQNIARQSCVHS